MWRVLFSTHHVRRKLKHSTQKERLENSELPMKCGYVKHFLLTTFWCQHRCGCPATACAFKSDKWIIMKEKWQVFLDILVFDCVFDILHLLHKYFKVSVMKLVLCFLVSLFCNIGLFYWCSLSLYIHQVTGKSILMSPSMLALPFSHTSDVYSWTVYSAHCSLLHHHLHKQIITIFSLSVQPMFLIITQIMD